MEQSSFIEYIKKYFPGIVIRIVSTLNDSNRPLPYLFKTMLRKQFSVDGKWQSITSIFNRVMADIVAMDSQLPLKKRDAKQTASGDIAKMGVVLWLNENQLTALDTLVATSSMNPDNMKQILVALFEDTERVIAAIYERLEFMFLQGLSTGIALADTENVGSGVRLNYGYLNDNKFGVSVLWNNPTTAKPFDDLSKVVDKATNDGNMITKFMLDRATLNNILATNQAKELFAFSVGFAGTNTPKPNLDQINSMTQANWGYIFQVVERSVKSEKNGIRTTHKPWEPGMVIGITNDVVGSLVWSNLAEKNRPVAGVSYQTADDYILVSKYRKNDPLSEFTSSQARVVPVISNVDEIYQLDSTEVRA